MSKSISILLGAGFSVPKGYPIGNKLNEFITNTTIDSFRFSQGGNMIISIDGSKPDLGYKTTYDESFEFCLEVIKYYHHKNGTFDYELFYDYLLDEAKNEKDLEVIAKPFKSDFNQLIYSLKNIYNQLVSYYLRDNEGKNWYDDEHYSIGSFYSGYTGFLNYLKTTGIDTTIHIHTLNHDLFFESLNRTDFLEGELCDGFQELGSPYYGKLEKDCRVYRCRLQRYTGNYNKRFCLYKLHGSLDYGVYSKSDQGFFIPENYLKIKYGIGFSELFKEKLDEHGNLIYENCWINYHADFLTGTTSKIERYTEPLLYKNLFERFRNNLQISDKLIIIGYGAKDAEINNMIIENYGFNKQVFVIDPYANDLVHDFTRYLKGVLITKHLENINNNDLK